MKRFGIFLILACALSTSACAQWYLFPGKKKPGQKTDTLFHRNRPDTTAYDGWHQDPAQQPELTERPDSTFAPDTVFFIPPEDVFILDKPDVIHIGLALPLQASAQRPSTNFLDFYSGALLALRDLGADGLRADLQVFDSADGKSPVSQSLIDENDVIIGPVSYEDLSVAAELCGRGKVLVSPLEPKAAALATPTGAVVQAPAPWQAQVDEMVRWVREELPIGDVLYVVRDSTALTGDGQGAYLLGRLRDSGLRFREVASTRDIPFQKGKKARVAIASEKDNFITSAVRNLSIEGARNDDVILYGTARTRTNGTAQTDLHNAQAHLAVSYYIDYDNPDVRRFILAYRALFQTEPGSFAFQGYDTMHYFVTMCSEYGRQWYKKLPELPRKGLQADFRFTEEEGGRINQAARRIIYNSDLSTNAQP